MEMNDQQGERHLRIAEAAYFRAERRGFTEDGAMQDWLDAEREIEAQEIIGDGTPAPSDLLPTVESHLAHRSPEDSISEDADSAHER